MDPSCFDHHNPPPMEEQKWWGQDSGLADLQEKIDTASCGEEEMGDCPGPRKETTDGPHVTQGGREAKTGLCTYGPPPTSRPFNQFPSGSELVILSRYIFFSGSLPSEKCGLACPQGTAEGHTPWDEASPLAQGGAPVALSTSYKRGTFHRF